MRRKKESRRDPLGLPRPPVAGVWRRRTGWLTPFLTGTAPGPRKFVNFSWQLLGRIPRPPRWLTYFRDEWRTVIDAIVELARTRYPGHISMLLLLSGLLEDELVAQLLDEIGVDPDALYAEVLRELE